MSLNETDRTALYETALDAVETLIRLCDRHGPEAVRDAIAEARDTPDEDAPPFANALFDAVQAAISEAEDVAGDQARIVLTPALGERITWSWRREATPDAGFANMVLLSVARMLGRHVPDPDPDTDPDWIVGCVTGPRQHALRYSIGEHHGAVFSEDEDFAGLVLSVEVPTVADAEAMVAKMDAIGAAGHWPEPDNEGTPT